MQIGAMNNPNSNLLKEIQWIGDNGFDFVDLTLEPPQAHASSVDIGKVRELLSKYGLSVVGHTAYYLPIASPFDSFCELALIELRKSFEVFQALEVNKVTIHADELSAKVMDRKRAVLRNVKSIKSIAELASEFGLSLIVENTISIFNTIEDFNMLFAEVEQARFHLDVGHANLNTDRNKTKEFLENFSDKLEHVHFSDNKGGSLDLHLPLGAGLINWEQTVDELKRYNYDGTITLEVFSKDKRYLLASKDKLIELWCNNKEAQL